MVAAIGSRRGAQRGFLLEQMVCVSEYVQFYLLLDNMVGLGVRIMTAESGIAGLTPIFPDNYPHCVMKFM